MLESFKTHITNNFPFLTESKLLIAISGGLDSVVLTHLCHKLKLDIALAHCNFNLRGTESDADEEFVLNLAETLNLEVFIEHFDTENYAISKQLSTQVAARELRYDWFLNLAEDLGFDYILTAHHADDNLETFLINLSRGTGLNGLTGIPEINGNVIRPLLPFSRAKIKDYANKNQIKWREDSSNTSDKYLRNKIRHHVIPNLKDINSELLHNFKKTLSHLRDSVDIIDDSLNSISKRAIVSNNEQQLKFKISEFKRFKNPKAYLYELFKDYGFTEWNDVLNLLDAQTGKQVFSKTHRLIKDREHLILTKCYTERSRSANEDIVVINASDRKVNSPAGILLFDEADAIFGTRSNVIFVDRDVLVFPLHLRRWQKGDAFYPYGMKGKKKLSKYFKDEKLSLVDKENIWLLISNDTIVWVIGMRGDERFKVTDKTSNILKIEVQ
ncbi:tRNA lysidine(34) synthetase TilS [Psychroserpens sp. MEBiC05023]